ncbi:MAG: ribonuclease HII [Chloroflexota bacterium]
MPQDPTYRIERPLWAAGAVRVAGVDEVGVAPTCGAVVAAAVIIRPNSRRIPGVRDSKVLSAAQRERLAPEIRRRAVAVGVGAASVSEIDRLNIYHATHLAMRRAIARLGGHDHVLVDGNRISGFESSVGPYSAIVRGDAESYSIACASVVAKVVRDRMMARLAVRYPGYGWERNQGYATLEHREAIRRLGLTPFHRRSFLALQRTLAGDQIGLGLEDDAPGFGDVEPLARGAPSVTSGSRPPVPVMAARRLVNVADLLLGLEPGLDLDLFGADAEELVAGS